MMRYAAVAALLFLACPFLMGQSADPLRWVDPFIGTGGHGHTFPGATLPFGMVQLSPDTRLDGWDGCSGYHYTDTVVYGFSHTHLSGTGVSDYADVLLMPTAGPIQLDNGAAADPDSGYASRFDKARERASAGYYHTFLTDYGITAELTATERAGFHRYRYAKGQREGNVILDILHRDLLTADSLSLERLAQGEISGYRYSRAWANQQRVHFVIRFSEPPRLRERELRNGRPVKVGLSFALPRSRELLVKVGISAVSIENARANLEAEIPHWDFDLTRRQAEGRWREELGRIQLEGGAPDQRANFYTALYHCMIAPNVWSDVNGEYWGMDGQAHRAEPGRKVYTVFSLWDTFRGNHPLMTLLQPERTQDFIRTFLLHYQQGGRLPVWELAANETDCMIGYHSVSVALDAYAKGLADWDHSLMLEAMQHSAGLNHFGLESYRKHGSVLASDEAESVSKTLEYAYDDWCIARFAHAMGEKRLFQQFSRRAQHYKNLYDPSTGFFRARVDGNWFGPFDPAEVNFNYTEANAWQYRFFAPHDLGGLIELMGGPEAFERNLDGLFAADSRITGRQQADITGLIGQYAHGNEPSHHVAYLYNFVGKPWKTQKLARRIMDEMYAPRPDGLSGNEDCGQMSAWYVLSALGFYPVTPGLPRYELGAPIFDKATVQLSGGRSLVIEAPQSGPVAHDITLNGRPLPAYYLSHDQLVEGGTLSFRLGPDTTADIAFARQTAPANHLVRNEGVMPIMPEPIIEAVSSTFTDSMVVSVASACDNCAIAVAIGADAPPTGYKGPIVLRESCLVQAWTISPNNDYSLGVKQHFYKIRGGRSATLGAVYANQYSAGGPGALIDYQRGGPNFRTGRWQGYEGQDFVATIDLGEQAQPREVGVGFLQDVGSWVFFPRRVQFSTSEDGVQFTPLAEIGHALPDRDAMPATHEFKADAQGRSFRYLRVAAKNYGPCPTWHPGAGGATWLFVDEVWAE